MKRRNCSPHAVKNYLNLIKHFIVWLDVPVEAVTHATVSRYIEHLMRKRLAPKTVNCHLNGIRQFYHYLREEEGVIITNPIKKTHLQKMSQPLPRHLRDEQVETFFKAIQGARDRAMFMLMLRCGLRVEEVANLTIGVIDVKRRTILVEDGKGGKDRVVYMSHDALQALAAYLRVQASIQIQKDLSGGKEALSGTAHLHPRHSVAHGNLCPPGQAQGVLSSSSAYHGHPAAQCRCRSLHHPGSLGS